MTPLRQRHLFLVLDKYGITLPSPVSFLIWALGFGLMSALALNQLLPLIDNYRNNNEAINVSIVLIDDHFQSPDITMLIPQYHYTRRDADNSNFSLYVREPEELMTIVRHLQNGTQDQCKPCEKLREVGWDIWNREYLGSKYVNYTLDTFYNALWLSFMTKIFETFGDQDILDEKFSAWNSPIFSAVLNFIMRQGQIDYFLRDISADLGAEGLGSELDNLVRQNSAKMDQLFDRALKSICYQIDFSEAEADTEFLTAVQTSRTCGDLLLGKDLDVMLDSVGLWIPLPSADTPVIKEYRFALQKNSSSRSILVPPPDSDHIPIRIYPDQSVLYSGDTDPITVTDVFRTPPGKMTNVGHRIAVKYSVQMRARDFRPRKNNCYKGNSAPVCFTKCTLEQMVEQCGCIPYLYRKGYGGSFRYPFCDFQAYVACNATSADARNEHCLRRCQRSCEFVSYNWQIVYDTFEPQEPNSMEIIVKTIPVYNSFTEFSWVEKETWEQFVAQMAGIGGLYLGLSGLTFVAGLVWFVEVMQKVWERRSGSSSEAINWKVTTSDCEQREPKDVWSTERTATKEVMTTAQYEKFEKDWQASLAQMRQEMKQELKEELKKEQQWGDRSYDMQNGDGWPRPISRSFQHRRPL